MHPQGQGLQSFKHDPGIERAERGAGMLDVWLDLIADEPLAAQNHPAQAPSLPVDMLGRRIDDDIGVKCQRVLEHGRREDIVDHQPRARFMRDLGHRPDIDDLERRVRGRLEETNPGLGPHGIAPLIQIGPIDQGHVDVEPRTERLDDIEARTEKRARSHQVISRAELAHQSRVHRCHAAGRGEGGLRPFQRGDPVLEHRHGRVAVAGVDEAFLALGHLALEPGLGGLGIRVDEALGQIDRLGGLTVIAPAKALVHKPRARTITVVAHASHPGKPGPYIHGPEWKGGLSPATTSLAECFTWPASRPDKSPREGRHYAFCACASIPE